MELINLTKWEIRGRIGKTLPTKNIKHSQFINNKANIKHVDISGCSDILVNG